MRRVMSKLVPLFVCAIVLLGLSATAASAQPVGVSIGADLVVGMKVFVTIGGDGCNCTGGATAVVSSGGRAIVTIDMTCAPSGQRPPTTGPNDKCRVMARALNEKTNQMYVGQGVLTTTSTGDYQSRFSLRVVPPQPQPQGS